MAFSSKKARTRGRTIIDQHHTKKNRLALSARSLSSQHSTKQIGNTCAGTMYAAENLLQMEQKELYEVSAAKKKEIVTSRNPSF
jgi:hypothetical protein